jgi:hypothetical protein
LADITDGQINKRTKEARFVGLMSNTKKHWGRLYSSKMFFNLFVHSTPSLSSLDTALQMKIVSSQ